MKHKINLMFGISCFALSIVNLMNAIDGKIIIDEPSLLMAYLLCAVGMGNFGVFIGGNQ